jgi:hypothetical protein
MSGFFGYGNYRAKWWFVGMEEGGGGSLESVARRLDAWEHMGATELVDIALYHKELGGTRYSVDRPPIQATWGKLIRIMIASEGWSITTENVRRYQRDRLGREHGDSALLELLPLPSPSASHWHYGEWSTLPHLRTREGYSSHMAPVRAQQIASRILKHKPERVVFYGVNPWYRGWWEQIAGVTFNEVSADGQLYYIGRDEHTHFAIIKHPASKGLRNEYFHEVGRALSGDVPPL